MTYSAQSQLLQNTIRVMKTIERLKQSGKRTDAIALLDETLRQKDFTDSLTLWCIGGELCEDTSRKLQYYNYVLERNPNHVRTLGQMAKLYRLEGDLQKSQQYTKLRVQAIKARGARRQQISGIPNPENLIAHQRHEPNHS